MNKEQIFEDGDIYLEIASPQVYREETDDYLVYVAGLYAPIAGSYTDRCLIADYDAIQDWYLKFWRFRQNTRWLIIVGRRWDILVLDDYDKEIGECLDFVDDGKWKFYGDKFGRG